MRDVLERDSGDVVAFHSTLRHRGATGDRRSFAFVEVGREDQYTPLHAGVRYWVRCDRFALDLSVQQVRGGGDKASGVVIGVAWYDL